MSNRKYLLSQLAIVLLAWLLLISLHRQNDGLWQQGDSPRHAANGLFWKEFLLSGSLNPHDYALRYYARYPVISPANYPPVFYLLEGAVFAAYHPSPYAAKCLVQVFALLAACYLMAWLRRWVAVEAGSAAALLLVLPGFVLWSNAVMLNIPAMAISLAALYHARRWLEASDGRAVKHQLYLTAVFSISAVLTYFLAGILVFIIIAWMLFLRRWDLLLSGRTVCVVLVVAALLLPFLYIALNWAPIHVGFISKSFQRAGTAYGWSFYLGYLPRHTGAYMFIVSILGLAIGIVRRRWRRESFLLLIFMLVIYLALSLIVAKEPRYGLLLLVPIVCFCAMAVQFFAECLNKWLKGKEGVSSTAALAVVLAVGGTQAWMVARMRVPCIQGIAETVAFIERVAPNEPVFYDGYFSNVFAFYLQSGDPQYRRRVVLGSKLLYENGIDILSHYRSNVSSSEEIVQTLQTRGGCRWLAIEISSQLKKIPAAVLLRETVLGPQFELVRSFPASGPGLDRIDVYRFKLNLRPTEETDMPFPTLGEGARFTISPIQR
jgi:hypothetical protein